MCGKPVESKGPIVAGQTDHWNIWTIVELSLPALFHVCLCCNPYKFDYELGKKFCQDRGTPPPLAGPREKRDGERDCRAQGGPAIEDGPSRQPPYTTFTLRQRRLMTFLLGFTTITPPLIATTYFPLLPLLAQRLDISAQAINLTITFHIIIPSCLARHLRGAVRCHRWQDPLPHYINGVRLFQTDHALSQNSYVVPVILLSLHTQLGRMCSPLSCMALARMFVSRLPKVLYVL